MLFTINNYNSWNIVVKLPVNDRTISEHKSNTVRCLQHLRLCCRYGRPFGIGNGFTKPCLHYDDDNIWACWHCWLPHSVGSHPCPAFTTHVCHQCHIWHHSCRGDVAYGGHYVAWDNTTGKHHCSELYNILSMSCLSLCDCSLPKQRADMCAQGRFSAFLFLRLTHYQWRTCSLAFFIIIYVIKTGTPCVESHLSVRL